MVAGWEACQAVACDGALAAGADGDWEGGGGHGCSVLGRCGIGGFGSLFTEVYVKKRKGNLKAFQEFIHEYGVLHGHAHAVNVRFHR